ncbi:MAG: protein-tyrosine-phosphatase [Bacteroidota bacterium]
MLPKIASYVSNLEANVEASRRSILSDISSHIQENASPLLLFICTHNSRRSHFAHIWAQVFATEYNVNISLFSGGTEVTSCHPNSINALERAGFIIQSDLEANPKYRIRFSKEHPPVVVYSKRYDAPENPRAGFAAIMTCSEADAACPIVNGATVRIPLTFNDPKISDDTNQQDEVYDATCREIANEMHYLFKRLHEPAS